MPENMKRKITVETSTSKSATSNDTLRRPSVFERLGTKAASSSTTSSTSVPAVIVGSESSSSCRHWGLTGSCPYGKSCKNASSHTLISPSKQRAAKKEVDPKQKTPVTTLKPLSNSAKDELNKRLHSAVIKKRTGASPDLNWENWDQTDLEYEDEKVLEKRRRLLQRELELQMSQEKEEQQKSQEKEDQQKKKKVKKVKKGVSSSSSTSGSSSSSSESSSSSDESSSSSSSTSADSRRKKMKPKTGKRDSSSSTSGADRKKKNSSKATSVPPGTKKTPPARKDEQRPQSSKKRESSIPKKLSTQLSAQPTASNKSRSTGSPSRNRHRSQSPQHSNDKSKSLLNTKSKGSAGHNLSPKRSQSADKKDRRNNSGSPRPSIRDRDRERDKERDRERDKNKEKEREKDRERDRDKDCGKSRGRDKSQSPGPNSRGKDAVSSPRRRPMPRDPRRRESPDMAVAKERSRQTSPVKSRRSVSRGRSSLTSKHPTSSREADRKDSNHDTRDKNGGAKKPDVRKGESMLKGSKVSDSSDAKGNVSRSKDDQDKSRRAADSSSSKNSSKKTLPVTSTSKSTQDRDFPSKSDKDRNSNKDPRDVSRDSKESKDRDGRDNSDPRLSRNTKSMRDREAAREKEREEALERCRERQRERERKAREEKARDEKVREEKAREEKAREHERELPSLLMIATHNPIKSSRNTGSEGSKDKGSERGSDRDRDSDKTIDRSRRVDRSLERNLNRSADRSDRDRGPERDRDRTDRHVDRDRSFDRGPDHERGIVRGPSDRDRLPERDRGFERDTDRALSKDSRSNNRSFDRSTERNFDRDSGRFEHGHPDRDNHSDREYAGMPPRGRDDRRPLGLDEKSVSGYDSPYEGRRGREERPRYGEPMERGRYDESVMSREDQRRSGDIRNYSDERRGHREARGSLEPGWATRNDRRSPNKSRDYEPRSPIKSRDYGSRSPNKSRDYEPRSPNKSRDYEARSPNKSRDYESRSPLIKGRDYEPRSPCHSLKGRDWDSRDYGDSRREWDGRGGRHGPQLEWDNQHRDWPDKEGPRPGMDDDWDMYGGQRDWPPGGGDRWTEEWDRPGRSSSGPPPRVPLDYVMPSPRDGKPDAPVPEERKDPSLDASAVSDKLPAKPEELIVKEASIESLKRPREAIDGELDKPEAKKICLEEPVPLEEDLSDISDDDADEILNREDIEMASNLAQQDQLSLALPSSMSVVGLGDQLEAERDKDAEKTVEKMMIESCRDSSEQHSMIAADDETVDSLDFEEISDEELEEEARAGLGDALGVDWASLVAEQKPRVRTDLLPGSARRRWDGHRMLARIGVSVRYLGQDMVDEISSKLVEMAKEDGEDPEEAGFLHPVASIHVSLREKKERRKELFTSAGPYRRALSARRDLLVRRQLCGLPVKETTVDSQGPNTEEIFRLAVQLFERGV